MASDKASGVETQTAAFSRASMKNSLNGEKQRSTENAADLDLPTYVDAERQGSSVASLSSSGLQDNTHRKLKARHIQLIGFVSLDRSISFEHRRYFQKPITMNLKS